MSQQLISVKQVAVVAGISVPSVWRMVRERHFPKPIKLGSRTTRWRLAEVLGWIEAGCPAL